MKNLKRVLSLGLASVMLLGMMVMGASAATFSDSDEIKNTEAVNMMAALNVIKGKDTGAFDPKGLVTRAEMAKMITMILFGGEEPALAAGTASKFSDVPANHWARKYIEYCAGDSLKIIAGNGDGTFAPDANITGTQAAKMALVALGYNAEVYGFENNKDWEININYRANAPEANLYAGLKGLNPSEQITRDTAAQILYNALKARIMKPSYTVTNNGIEIGYILGAESETMLATRFDVGTVYGTLGRGTYNDKTETYTYALAGADNASDEVGAYEPTSFTFKEDLTDLYKHNVAIVYANDEDNTILGVSSYKTNIVVSGALGDIEDLGSIATTAEKIKVDDKEYDLKGAANTVDVFLVNGASAETNKLNNYNSNRYYAFELIDNDNDKKGDVVVVHPVLTNEVTFVNSTTVTAGVSYRFDKNDIYEDVKKGDKVTIVPATNSATGKATIRPVETVTGKITALNNAKQQLRMNGEWYTDNGTFGNSATFKAAYSVSDELDMVVINGWIVSAETVKGAKADVSKTVYVTKVAGNIQDTTISGKTQEVELLFADGNKETVKVNKFEKVAGTYTNIDTTEKIDPDTVWTYETKDGAYQLKLVDQGSFEAIKNGGTAIDIAEGKATAGASTKNGTGTFRFNDNAVVFVKATSGSAKVLTGADINEWGKSTHSTTADAKNMLYANASNGFNYVELGVLFINESSIPGTESDTMYGWITADSIMVVNDEDEDKNCIQFTIWNGQEEVTLLADNKTNGAGDGTEDVDKADENTFVPGTLVSYRESGSGHATWLKAESKTADAVKAYDGSKIITFVSANSGDETEITDKTVILYIDTAKNEGAVGGAISRASQDAAGNYVKNVYVVTDDANDEVDLLIVDVSNKLDGMADDFTAATGSVVTAVDTTEGAEAITVASSSTVTALLTEVADWGTNVSAAVVNAANENQAGATEVATGMKLIVVSEDGSKTITYAITVA